MKDKLEAGMYVRTKKGNIYKFETNNSMAKNGAKKYMVNCSHNIIDLIEVGDYVNGNEVMEADWINEDGEYEEGLAFPMYASDDLEVIENWLPLRSVPIKSIVTKQQFESMEYKVC